MKYRTEVDGLRTIAVIPVILFHLNFNLFSGGYVGVDIFFVISGFLISTIILEEIESHKFSIINFYERRARRILPALFFILILTIIFSWFLLQPYEFIKFHKSLFSVLTFSSNIFFWKDGDYFLTDSSLKPLLHTWSLAVEEQFYLFFPFFLIFIKRFNKKTSFFILLFFTLISFILCQISSVYFKTSNFYLLPTRFWELSLGSIAAMKIDDFKNLAIAKKNEIFGFIGLALILISIFFFDETTPFPSFLTLLPTFGTVLIIIFVSKNDKIGKLLSNKFIVRLGLLSYSAYLFHQPLISFFQIYLEENLHLVHKILIFLLTFILAYFSYYFIELTFKNKLLISRKKIFSYSILFCISLILYSIFIFKFVNFPFEKDLAKKLSNSRTIISTNMDDRVFTKFLIEYYNLKPDVLVLGSSRIMQFSSSKNIGNVLNLSVSGSSIEDQITFGVLALQKFTPKTVYLGADPWLFNENSGQDRYLSVKQDYEVALRLIQNPQFNIDKFQNYNKVDSIYTIFNIYKKLNIKYSKIEHTNDKPGIYNKIRFDGSRIYNIKYANRNQVEISKNFNDLILYSINDYKFNRLAFHNYEKLIDYIKGKSINVILVFSPFHPVLFQKLSQDPNFIYSQNRFIQLAKNKSISIIGSYNPEKCGCTISDFYDGMHPKDSCINNIISNY
jgi:peptidoglycan/LPS O-acetylase OafA/YrhL